MAFAYLAGTTTLGAANEVVDWFATFEGWISGVGWSVEAGGGTTDLIIRSASEAGGLTMLYVRVWQDLGNPTRVRMEVQNDLGGTQFTTADGFVDSGGVQFQYFMGADLDAIYICFKAGAGYRVLYAGLVIPFANTVADETRHMIATDDSWAANSALLRNAAGLWDQNAALQDDNGLDDSEINPNDGSFMPYGIVAGTGVNIAGQLKHCGGIIAEPTLLAEDTITTGQPGATTTWIVLQDSAANRLPFRSGGVMPAGFPPGNFVSTNGIAVTVADIYAAMAGLLVPIGWVDLGFPPVCPWSDGRFLRSTGENGTEDIIAGVARQLNIGVDEFYSEVWDDVARTHEAHSLGLLDAATEFPLNYWISGDRDEFCLVCQRAGGYTLWYAGKGYVFAPGLPDTIYKVVAARQGLGGGAVAELLRRHDDGAWGFGTTIHSGILANNTNPSAFDGATYFVWPRVFTYPDAPFLVPISQAKYFGFSSGGGIANLDTITVGGEIWTVFFDGAGVQFVLRTT